MKVRVLPRVRALSGETLGRHENYGGLPERTFRPLGSCTTRGAPAQFLLRHLLWEIGWMITPLSAGRSRVQVPSRARSIGARSIRAGKHLRYNSVLPLVGEAPRPGWSPIRASARQVIRRANPKLLALRAVRECPSGGMVDALVSNASDRKVMRVQVPRRAPTASRSQPRAPVCAGCCLTVEKRVDLTPAGTAHVPANPGARLSLT